MAQDSGVAGAPRNRTLLLALACGLVAACSETSTEVVVEGWQPTYASVVAGLRHSCALDVDGYAYCWGFNGAGALGVPQGALIGRGPEPVTRSLRFSQLAAGNSFTCGVTRERDVYCWGWPPWGIFPLPTRIDTELEFASVAAGAEHVCGVLVDARIACWGSGSSGQLGNGRYGASADERLPAVVPGLDGIESVTAGATSSCALDAEGSLSCWGAHDAGQLGVGVLDDGPCSELGSPFPCAASPLPVLDAPRLVTLGGGQFHACGADATGAVLCWGDGGDGQLDPLELDETCLWAPPSGAERACSRTPTVLFSGMHVFTRVYGGGFHSCGLTAAGEAYCWGADFLGQLGFGGGPIPDGPLPVAGGHRWTDLALGQVHTCGVTTNGEAYCWGDGQWDQLGAGKEFVPTPARVLPVG